MIPFNITIPEGLREYEISGKKIKDLFAELFGKYGSSDFPEYDQETKATTYRFKHIFENMLTGEEFGTLLQLSGIEMKNVILYLHCQNILDQDVPASFPYSTVAAQLDEEGAEIEPERQLTFREYFPVYVENETECVIRTTFKRAGNNHMLTEDWPDKDTFGLIFGTINAMGVLLGEPYAQQKYERDILPLFQSEV